MPTTNPEKKFLAAYDQYADPVFRFCYYRVYDREKARELTQEAFTRTWQQIADGVEIQNIRAMVYRITRNLIIDYSRKKKEDSLEALQASGFDPGTVFEEERLQRRIDAHRLIMLLNKLDALDQECIELHYIQGLRIKDIATILDQSQNSISVRLYRAMRKLKKIAKYEKIAQVY